MLNSASRVLLSTAFDLENDIDLENDLDLDNDVDLYCDLDLRYAVKRNLAV